MMKKKGQFQEVRELTVEGEVDRLDKYLAAELKDYSRSYIQKLIEKELVLINSKPNNKPAQSLNPGDKITVKIPPPQESSLSPCDLDLEIIYQDNDIAVVNKPANLVVHPAQSHQGPTLVEGLLYQLNNLSGIGGEKRPGIVHRLDKNTTGALVIAKNDKAHRHLAEQFKERKVKKIYRAFVKGYPRHDKAKIKAPIGRDPYNRKKMTVRKENSKEAISRYQVVKKYNGFSEVEIELLTGRTHQIRVHLQFIGHPILGDKKYRGPTLLKNDVNNEHLVTRSMLHAWKLGFIHPGLEEFREFTADFPADYLKLQQFLSGKLS